MENISQNSDLEAYNLLPSLSQSLVAVPPVGVSSEPEDSLASENELDKLRFYAKALMLQRYAPQRQSRESTYTNNPAPELMLTAGRSVEQLLYAFALIFSPKRSNHSGDKTEYAGGEIAACALRERPLRDKGEEAKSYILFVAKNNGFSEEDRLYQKRIRGWFRRRMAKDDDICSLVMEYLVQRIQSYKDGVSEIPNFQLISPANTAQTAMQEQLVSLHEELAESCEPDRLREILREAANFVAQNRELAFSLGLCSPSSNRNIDKMWDEIERLSRVEMAVKTVKEFRKEVKRTGSRFSIVPVTSKDNALFSDGVTFTDAIKEVETYANRISVAEREALSLTKEDLESLKIFRELVRSLKNIHCEVQLVEHFLFKDYQGLTNVYDYIGCSKEPCWLCDYSIRTATNFRMTESHGGIYWNWPMPGSLIKKSSSFRGVIEVIDNEMLEIIKTARFAIRPP